MSLPSKISAIAPKSSIYSLGGATEASIWSILYPIPNDINATITSSIPYGKPMYNQTFFVLNEELNYCPCWVEGELYIGGIGLALEYLKEPEKTKKSFIIHPKTGKITNTMPY